MIFTAQCSICKSNYAANNASAMTEWLESHERDGTTERRLHQIAGWLSKLTASHWIPDSATPKVRLERIEEFLRGALSGEDEPVLMA